jgi:hypothetical protein
VPITTDVVGSTSIVLNATFTQQYFSYIVAVSFIGGGNLKKPPTYRKSLPIFIA